MMQLARSAAGALLLCPAFGWAQLSLPLGAEPGAGGLFLSTAPGGYRQATRLATDVRIEVSGLVARVAVAQRFRNEGSDWVEGIYVFPLPDDAAVDTLVMQIGDRRIEGEIKERAEAQRTYEAARAAGQQASLVEQERPNLFTTQVANIAPGQEIVIEIGYLQTARFDQGQFTLRFPMTLTPRYIPGAADAAARGLPPATTAVPDAARITPPVLDPSGPIRNLAAVEVLVNAGAPLAEIGSPSHEMVTGMAGPSYQLTPVARRIAMDRDLVVTWRVSPSSAPRALAFSETVAGERYVLMMILPPPTASLPEPTPRELVFVIDTSGSMGGQSIEQAKAALAWSLGRLTAIDRFNVIEFNSEMRALYPAPVDVTTATTSEARRFVAGLSANGGTNMAPAIAAAIAQPQAAGTLRQIVFITDGSVGNEAGLFRLISDELGEARLFTVGIGSAPNSLFMRKAAQFGRGSYLHIARIEEVEPGMRELFDKLQYVALKEIDLGWPVEVEAYPQRLPDLYRGEPVVAAARTAARTAADETPLRVTVSGMSGRFDWSDTVTVTSVESPGVASIWARRKIESLLDSRLTGATEKSVRAAVVDVALRHGMLSPYTSLVAVDKTPEHTRNALLRRERLGNMLPAGSDPNALFGRLPNTAAGAGLYELIGTVLACLILGLLGVWRLTRQSDR